MGNCLTNCFKKNNDFYYTKLDDNSIIGRTLEINIIDIEDAACFKCSCVYNNKVYLLDCVLKSCTNISKNYNKELDENYSNVSKNIFIYILTGKDYGIAKLSKKEIQECLKMNQPLFINVLKYTKEKRYEVYLFRQYEVPITINKKLLSYF